MKANLLRTCSLVLVVSMLVLLAACSGGSGNGTGTKAPTTTKSTDTTANANAITTELEPLNDEIQSLNYDDATVRILSRGASGNWAKGEIAVEELNSDPINDAVYNRNLTIEEMLGVKIEEKTTDEYNTGTLVRQMVSAGDSDYDIIADSVAYGTPLINEGLYFNLYDNEIETYLDASKPWWSQKWIKEAQMGDRLYCITGALSLSLTRLLFVTYYNKNLAEDLNVEDLYTVVNDGRWTIDYIGQLVSGIYTDLNGNDTKDEEDQYGLAINHYECCDVFWSAFDMDFISKDSDGWFELSGNQEKISNAFEKVYALIRENKGTYDTIETKGFAVARDMFAEGNVLLASLHLQYAESEKFRNMQDEYGILPAPKYDESQSEYYSYAHDQYTVFLVPITVKDPVMSGAVLEALCYESYKSVQPAYYDLALKGRYANDQESRQMLDIVTNGFTVDAAWIYGRQLGLPAAVIFRGLIYEGSKSFASAYARVERTLPLGLREMREKIEAFDY